MQDDAKTESELNEFFAGMNAGLDSLREVRTAYDEQIAFDFNLMRFFNPGETKISEILAFFLNPNEKHGQKRVFLQIFLEHFNIKNSDEIKALLSADEAISVESEHRTEDNRRIDITIFFKNSKFAIGIENKIGAPDQKKQVLDYCKYLEKKTVGNYKLLYLSPDGHDPSEDSIEKGELKKLMDKAQVRIVSYDEIVNLFGKYETVCRADNVRGFIRQFQHYIKQDILGEPFMEETNFVMKCIRERPDILKHTDALGKAVEFLKKELFSEFWNKVASRLKENSITINSEDMKWRTSGFSQTAVIHRNNPFNESGGHIIPYILFDLTFPDPLFQDYIAIKLDDCWNKLPEELKGGVTKLEDGLKKDFPDVRESLKYPNFPYCAYVRLQYPELNKNDELCEFVKDKDESKMTKLANEAAKIIKKYIDVTGPILSEINSKK